MSMAARMLALALAGAVATSGCGTARQDAPSQAELADALATSTGGGIDGPLARCMASRMLDSDLSDRLLQSFANPDGSNSPGDRGMKQLVRVLKQTSLACQRIGAHGFGQR